MACRRVESSWMSNARKYLPKEHRRWLRLHEYQSQQLLRAYNAPVLRGGAASTAEEVRSLVDTLGGNAIIKSQVLRGSRKGAIFTSGLKGGVQIVQTAKQAHDVASKMLGHKLQTDKDVDGGTIVNKVYVSELAELTGEWYVAMTIDREAYTPVLVISKAGGYNLEQITREHPDTLLRYCFKISEGITPDMMSQISLDLGISRAEAEDLENVLHGLYRIFTEREATHLEINPLARLSDGSFTCVSTDFTFDDAAAKRQKELFTLRDVEQEVPEEVEAEKHGLVYVKMDGNIGNVVNGAGLAMATNDAIGLHGGRSANFLDGGGQATKQTMLQAFAIIMRDERVKTILVNIYGGITNCAMIAESIIGAAEELGPLRVPVVVRLQGTNSSEGLKLLEEANLGLYVEAGFGDAAKKAVELAAATK